MITRAKANLSAVKPFKFSVSSATDYSPSFDRGIQCLEELYRQLSDYANSLGESKEHMASALETLEAKKESIEEILARLTAQQNNLEDELADLESQMESTPSSITLTDEKGEEYEISNPAYEALCAKAAAVEAEINVVKEEMYPHQVRLEHVNSVNGRLNAHLDAINSVIYSLNEKRTACRQLQNEFAAIQSQNLSQGTIAVSGLQRIEEIIAAYLKIKMKYENVVPAGKGTTGGQDNININLSFSKTINHQETINVRYPDITREEIEKHSVQFDDAGRIALYDGKTFGGKHNSYDDRLGRTITDDNPVRGKYEGPRGESKFVPSRRTVEGITVIEILSQYGIDGIVYRNAEPDFEVCSEAVVKISAMTENRENYADSNGEIVFGNFAQADIELARIWCLGKRDGRDNWKPEDVFDYRKANNLTWHEKCDMETMVLVRSEINLFFNHSGGCSECRMRDAVGMIGGEFDE